jgi:hypothetical protein
MTAPDWLMAHDGGLTNGPHGERMFVTLGGEPLWRLDVVPAKGQFSATIVQTNNGKRLDEGKICLSRDAALASGLEELRTKLGW